MAAVQAGLRVRPDDAQWVALLDEADSAIARLRRDGPEVLRRARAGGNADGYPSRSGPADGSGGHGDSGPERIAFGHWSTERQDAGMQGELDDPYARGVIDPVRRAANGMVHCLRVALGELRKADGDRDQVVGEAAKAPAVPLGSRATSLECCWCCGAPAHPIVAGMCTVCLTAWDAAGRPDRAEFRVGRRQALAGGRLLAKVMDRVIPDDALRLPKPGARTEACALCGHDPACARVPAWDDQTPVLVCDHCYQPWVAGQRP